MKKAKLILAGIAIFAVAGGVYASKAKRIDDLIFIRTTTATNICTVPLSTYTLVAGGGFYTTTYATSVLSATCTTLLPVYHGE